MNWNDAKDASTKLGNGWRLPYKEGLDLLYKKRIKLDVLKFFRIGVLKNMKPTMDIQGLASKFYW